MPSKPHPLLGLIAAAVLALAPAAPGADAAGTARASAVAEPGLPGSATLLASATPKTVALDPATGAVLAVWLGEPSNLYAQIVPDISGGTDCLAGDGCYYTPVVDGTYHDRSFYGGSGIFSGDWPRRNAWDTGSYTASACWQSACSQAYGPNTYVTFNGSLVTGTSFTIH